eukprot:GHVP01035952.1.p1 GENE.GHVP01035952.1~~GHVP01035952.1.p1  ORF type:complete len:319 (+),score=43.84 GHVP01035952.1:291-1247(+)
MTIPILSPFSPHVETSKPFLIVMYLSEQLCSGSTTTMIELVTKTRKLKKALIHETGDIPGVISGCELFLKICAQLHIYLTPEGTSRRDFSNFKSELYKFSLTLPQVSLSRKKEASVYAYPILPDEGTYLLYSYSTTVIETLKYAYNNNKKVFTIIVDGNPNNMGIRTSIRLDENNIRSYIISDNSVSGYISLVDSVMIGAEAILKNGSICAHVGLLQVCLLAKRFKKPVYVIVDQSKILSELSPDDKDKLIRKITNEEMEILKHSLVPNNTHDNMECMQLGNRKQYDFIPADLITLFVTDTGVKSPLQMHHDLMAGQD